ncbi:unnamed protein product [Larinioides sclopetarius]
MGVHIYFMQFRVLELGISVVCLTLFIACFKISGWAEEGIIPYVWHQFGSDIAVFTITLAVVLMGMAVFERYRNRTLVKDNGDEIVDLLRNQGEKQRQRRWLSSFLCIGSSTDKQDEQEADAVGVDDFKTEKANS